MHKPALALVMMTAAFAAACGGGDDDGTEEVRCADETRADDYVPGMEKAGDDGLFTVKLMDSVPGPPLKGDNAWTVEVLDTGGNPVEDSIPGVTPFMPDHGHGTPIAPIVTATGAPGTYQIDRINLWMPGLWEVRFDITSGGDTDRVVFAFCIEG